MLDFGIFLKMVISPGGGMVAGYTASGDVHVLSIGFKKSLSKFLTK